LGKIADARHAFLTVLQVDPTDTGAYQFLSPIHASEGDATRAALAHSLYLRWRDDPMAQSVAERFFAARPMWADERIGLHYHNPESAPRSVLTERPAEPQR